MGMLKEAFVDGGLFDGKRIDFVSDDQTATDEQREEDGQETPKAE